MISSLSHFHYKIKIPCFKIVTSKTRELPITEYLETG